MNMSHTYMTSSKTLLFNFLTTNQFLSSDFTPKVSLTENPTNNPELQCKPFTFITGLPHEDFEMQVNTLDSTSSIQKLLELLKDTTWTSPTNKTKTPQKWNFSTTTKSYTSACSLLQTTILD